jgi:hypothetical protein
MGRIDEILEQEALAAEAAEATADAGGLLPAGTKVTRGGSRSKNLQVRFRDDEFEELSAYAAEQGLPVSTVVRLLVLKSISPADDLKSALDRLETDVAAVRRKALSG